MNAKIIGPKEGQYLNVIGDQQWIKLRGEDANGAFGKEKPNSRLTVVMWLQSRERRYSCQGRLRTLSRLLATS